MLNRGQNHGQTFAVYLQLKYRCYIRSCHPPVEWRCSLRINECSGTTPFLGWNYRSCGFVFTEHPFFYISVRRDRSNLNSIDQRTEFGDIQISVETIENLCLKAASRVRGVKDLKSRIKVSQSGLDIAIRAVVDGEESIPTLTTEVQKQVHDFVEDTTGIPVSSVSVYIANVVQAPSFKSRVE